MISADIGSAESLNRFEYLHSHFILSLEPKNDEMTDRRKKNSPLFYDLLSSNLGYFRLILNRNIADFSQKHRGMISLEFPMVIQATFTFNCDKISEIFPRSSPRQPLDITFARWTEYLIQGHGGWQVISTTKVVNGKPFRRITTLRLKFKYKTTNKLRPLPALERNSRRSPRFSDPRFWNKAKLPTNINQFIW